MFVQPLLGINPDGAARNGSALDKLRAGRPETWDVTLHQQLWGDEEPLGLKVWEALSNGGLSDGHSQDLDGLDVSSDEGGTSASVPRLHQPASPHVLTDGEDVSRLQQPDGAGPPLKPTKRTRTRTGMDQKRHRTRHRRRGATDGPGSEGQGQRKRRPSRTLRRTSQIGWPSLHGSGIGTTKRPRQTRARKRFSPSTSLARLAALSLATPSLMTYPRTPAESDG